MNPIHIGCSGFPINRAGYFGTLASVEIRSSFIRLPRLDTARRWRQEAPRGFIFSLQATSGITHPSPGVPGSGFFRRSAAVSECWSRTAEVADALKANFVLFETPASFYPNADHLRDMYAFFKGVGRGRFLFAWQPHGKWEAALVRKICGDLRLIHAVDPLAVKPEAGSVRYFRMSGAGPGRPSWRGHGYSDGELRELRGLCEEKASFVFFLNADMWKDARRFQAMTNPITPLRPSRYWPPRGGGQ